MSEMFAPAVGCLNVECMLLVRCIGLHLPPQLRVVFGLIMCGFVNVLISLP
jgi:hypothetical protein